MGCIPKQSSVDEFAINPVHSFSGDATVRKDDLMIPERISRRTSECLCFKSNGMQRNGAELKGGR